MTELTLNRGFDLKTGWENLSAFLYKNRAWVLLAFFVCLFAINPAFADDPKWATTLKKDVAEKVMTGLKILCYPIACCAGIWIVICLWTGSKRLQDMIPWLIGAALLVALPEFAQMISDAAKFSTSG